ncbi:MAG: DUF1919 domain-containing protein [Bacillales bacterium]|jgi:uncharacterized protein (DUF1919 family)|nr:DUF1919 domain-containing protein [Bacillales bacterium]
MKNIKLIIEKIRRRLYWKKYGKRVNHRDFSLFSNNCLAGIIYHELKIKFLSPTINTFINPIDFIKFSQNINYYLSLELEYNEMLSKSFEYPVGNLGDVTIFFPHKFKNFKDAKEKFLARSSRINYEKIGFIFCDGLSIGEDNNETTNENIFDFLQISYNKIIITAKKIEDVSILHSSKVFFDLATAEKILYSSTKIIDFINSINNDKKDSIDKTRNTENKRGNI